MKIILDVDTGIDDAIAIILANVHETVDLLGITTVSGNVNLKQATINTLNLLERLDLTVDVFTGEVRPLDKEKFHATDIHGANGLNGQLIKNPRNSAKGDAIPFYIEQVNKYPDEIVLVATGPCTNIARFILAYPEEAKKLKRLVLMTGAFFEQGNVTEFAEFNAYCDPEALQVVANFDMDVTFIGLDVTRKAKLYEIDLLQREGEIYRFIHKIVEGYFNMYQKNFGERAILMHDPLALLVALDPALVNTRQGSLSIILNGEQIGKTIYDNMGSKLVAETLDVESFRSTLIRLLDKMEGL